MTNAKYQSIKNCAITSAKWGASVALASFAMWIVVSGIFDTVVSGMPGEVIYYKAFVVPRLGVVLQDFVIVFYITFLITALKSSWSQRRALLTVTQ